MYVYVSMYAAKNGHYNNKKIQGQFVPSFLPPHTAVSQTDVSCCVCVCVESAALGGHLIPGKSLYPYLLESRNEGGEKQSDLILTSNFEGMYYVCKLF